MALLDKIFRYQPRRWSSYFSLKFAYQSCSSMSAFRRVQKKNKSLETFHSACSRKQHNLKNRRHRTSTVTVTVVFIVEKRSLSAVEFLEFVLRFVQTIIAMMLGQDIVDVLRSWNLMSIFPKSSLTFAGSSRFFPWPAFHSSSHFPGRRRHLSHLQ